MKRPLIWSAAIVAVLLASGCTTTGPSVSQTEIDQAREELRAKAVRYRHQQLIRLAKVGHHLITSLPADPEKKPAPYLGFLVDDVDKYVALAYSLPEGQKGVLLVGTVPSTPAADCGFLEGDVITQINDHPVKNQQNFDAQISKLVIGSRAKITVLRRGDPVAGEAVVGEIPRRIDFKVIESDQVNALTDGKTSLGVTYGMMRFLQSDDELAIVIGHELAHITQGHYGKTLGTAIVSGIIGGVLGGLADYAVPGIGQPIAHGISGAAQSGFSQDLEREADYVGCKYVHAAGFNISAGADVWERMAIEAPGGTTSDLFNTHPTTPERFVRMKKIVAELGPAVASASPAAVPLAPVVAAAPSGSNPAGKSNSVTLFDEDAPSNPAGNPPVLALKSAKPAVE